MSFGHLSLILYVCLIFGTSLVGSLYFNLGETEKKCFIEDVPDDTMIVGNYKVEMFDRLQNKYIPTLAGLGMHVRVHDPDEKVVMSRESISGHYRVLVYDTKLGQFVYTVAGRLGVHVEVYDPDDLLVMSRTYAAEGRFTFTSHISGEHQICLFSNSSAWFGGSQLRVHLDLRVGEGTNDYAEIASKDKLSELQLRVRQLLDQVQQITKEQNYQRTREERFRQTSDSTNQRVLWWAIAQTIILLITGFGQMRHLKSFFEAKKLV